MMDNAYKEIDAKASEFCDKNFIINTDFRRLFLDCARYIADWQKEHLTDKACKWLDSNIGRYTSVIASDTVHISFDSVLSEFRKEMKGTDNEKGNEDTCRVNTHV